MVVFDTEMLILGYCVINKTVCYTHLYVSRYYMLAFCVTHTPHSPLLLVAAVPLLVRHINGVTTGLSCKTNMHHNV